MEELKSLDLNELNQKTTNFDIDIDVDDQKIDQLKENSIEGDKEISIKDDDNQEKEIKIKELESSIDRNDQDLKIKSYQIVDKENNEKKAMIPVKENKIQAEIKALIPLPPKPKYGYLKKWLLRKYVLNSLY